MCAVVSPVGKTFAAVLSYIAARILPYENSERSAAEVWARPVRFCRFKISDVVVYRVKIVSGCETRMAAKIDSIIWYGSVEFGYD